MASAHHLYGLRFAVVALVLAAVPTGWSQTDAGIITRRGAEVRGLIEGALHVLGEGEVDIAAGGAIAGDVVVPPERSGNRGGAGAEKRPSQRTVIKNRNDKAGLGGAVRAAPSYETPQVFAPAKKRQGRDLDVVEAYVLQKDLVRATGVALRHERARVQLPPNSYGSVSVQQGTLVLGFTGVTQPMRYEFQSFDVQSGGHVEVLSPVVVVVKDGGSWSGEIGNPAAVFWLDVRVAGGPVLLNGGQFHGHLTAPASLVTLGERANFVGGLVSDRLVVMDRARIRSLSPDWAASDGRGPATAHRALRLQQHLPALRAATKSRYFPGVSYIEDVPYIMLAEGTRSAEVGEAPEGEHEAVFEAFRAAFADSGFSRAFVVLARSGDSGTALPQVSNLVLTRAQFDTLLAELGTKPTPAENIDAVRDNPELLEQFAQRCLALGRSTPGGG